MDRDARRLGRENQRRQISHRLHAEGASDLASLIDRCHKIYPFICAGCGHEVDGRTRCKRKWCPHCAATIARDRNIRMHAAVERFKFPLFITLTMKNVDDLSLGGVRQLRRAFGKLRHQKFWKHAVRGGVACIEVTNEGRGWHPHLHAVVDCAWLTAETRAIPGQRKKQFVRYQPDWSRAQKKKEFQRAAASVERQWSRLLKQPTSSIRIKRCSATTILKEVVKYTVKGSDLAEAHGAIAPMIRAIDATRMMTTFGTAYRLSPHEVRLAAKAAKEKIALEKRNSDSQPEPDLSDTDPWHCSCTTPEFIPREIWDSANKRADAKAWRDGSR